MLTCLSAGQELKRRWNSQKIRNLSNEELRAPAEDNCGAALQGVSAFQVALGQNDGVKKIRLLRKEIAQIKTVARGNVNWASVARHELDSTAPAGEKKTAKVKEAAPAQEAGA